MTVDERLRAAARELRDEMTEVEFPSLGVALRPARHRAIVATCAAAIVVLATAVVIVSTGDGRDRSIGGINDSGPSVTEAPATTNAPTTTSSATSEPPSTEPPVTTPPSAAPLGEGLGVYIDPAALPDGWRLTGTSQEDGELGGGGSDAVLSETNVGRYSADRSRVVSYIQFSLMKPGVYADLASANGPLGDPVEVRGLTAYRIGGGLVWWEGDRVARLAASADVTIEQLAIVANGLVDRGDGFYDATLLPDGYEQISVHPGFVYDYGPSWVTSYGSAAATDTNPSELSLEIVANPGDQAEDDLANGEWAATAAEIGGRRVVVHGTHSLFRTSIEWDEPSGERVNLVLGPSTNAWTDDDVLAFLEVVIAAVKRATPYEWQRLQETALRERARLAERRWIAEGLSRAGLTAAGDVVAPSSVGPYPDVYVVPARAADGSLRSCEFFRTELVTCTSSDEEPMPSDSSLYEFESIDGGYWRVVAGEKVTLVSATNEHGSSSGNATPLFADGRLRVAYVRAKPGIDRCFVAFDAAGTRLGELQIDPTQGPCPAEF